MMMNADAERCSLEKTMFYVQSTSYAMVYPPDGGD
jgi:hypothetical protein